MDLGVNVRPLWRQALPSTFFGPWLDLAAAAGVTLFRFDVNWQEVPISTPRITDLCAMLARKDATPVAVLCGSGQNWAWPDPWAYAVAAGDLASLLPPGSMIEVWNEPNVVPNFAPKRDPLAYARMLYTAYAAIKQANPQARVIGGVLAFNDAQYLKDLLAVHPAPMFDLFSIHPYTVGKPPDARIPAHESFIQAIDDFQAILDTTPLLLSECGWECETPAKDAQAASNYRAARDIARFHAVEGMIAYHLGDSVDSPPNALLNPKDRTPSLSWRAFTGT